MLQPLAIVFYEKLMPGSQLVNRLQDLGYRVLALNNPALLAATAKRESPLLVFADLDAPGDISGAIQRIKADAASAHLPVIAFAPDHQTELLTVSQTAGANGDVTILVMPGNLRMSFSGHDIRHADGRQLQRVGLHPDVEVHPTLKGLQSDRDEVLDRALQLARGGK